MTYSSRNWFQGFQFSLATRCATSNSLKTSPQPACEKTYDPTTFGARYRDDMLVGVRGYVVIFTSLVLQQQLCGLTVFTSVTEQTPMFSRKKYSLEMRFGYANTNKETDTHTHTHLQWNPPPKRCVRSLVRDSSRSFVSSKRVALVWLCGLTRLAVCARSVYCVSLCVCGSPANTFLLTST